MFRSRSIALRLQLGIGAATGLVLGVTAWINFSASRAELETQTNAQAIAEIRAAARRLDDFVARIGMLPRSVASRQQALGRDPDPGLIPYLRQLLGQMPAEEVYGIYIAYEHKHWSEEDSMPWVDRKSWPDATRVKYDYHESKNEWYNGPKLSRKFHVTEPYFDEGGSDINMVSLTVPVLDAAGSFVGTAGADLSLDRVREMVRVIRLRAPLEEERRDVASEYAFLVSRAGKVVAHPDEDLMLRKGFPGADLASLPGGQSVSAALEGFTPLSVNGERRRLYWAESPLTGWKTVLNVSEEAILVPVRQLTLRSALIGVLGLTAIVVIVAIMGRRLADPLRRLTRTSAAIEQGSFNAQLLGDLPERQDELGELAHGFQKMAAEIQVREQRLAEWNQNLERTIEQRTTQLTARSAELEALTRRLEEKAELESSLSALNAGLRGDLTVSAVAACGLEAFVDFLKAPMAGLFVRRGEGRLECCATHAYPDDPGRPREHAPGEGILGEAARSGKAIQREPGQDVFKVQFGFGSVAPSVVIAHPLIASGIVVGVVELCLFQGLSELQATWLEKAAEAVGNALRFAQESEDRKQAAIDLDAARAKAEEATELKSMFLANMSHEIRTPMNAIIGLSHLALKTPLNPRQRDYLSKIHNAGTSLLSIINDILDFSKIEAGKLDIEETDFKLDDIISSVTTVTGQKAHEKGLEFLAEVAGSVPQFLRGDPLRLSQILTNLVNNAVKFTERGEIHLRAALLERAGDKCQLKFSVRDTGLGMSREQSARLFQPFTQADMSTTRKHGGTGLGLTICRRLVELMGGQIWLESEPGAGSTFHFTVWLGVAAEQSSGRIVPERLAELRVLVADDNPAAREILQDALRDIASRVDTVSSGPEAVAAVKKMDADQPYDVVCMDWRMPGMDGLQAARLIKSDETLRRQPAILLITAFGREEVREEAERLRLDGFLVKPVTRSLLVDALVSVFASPGDETGALTTPGEEDGARLKGMRVLLTEDNEINQQIARELLEGVGATVDIANHGREAVERLFQGVFPPPYDVVLMDLQMPEMDGYQATAKIRSDERFARLPIIAMTAHATTEERHRCLQAGMNDHVAKPIAPALLYETLGRFYRPPESAALPDVGTGPTMPGPSGGEARVRAPEPGDISFLEGFDAKGGLGRVGGNRTLYLKLLGQFAEEQGSAPAEIAGALARGDAAVAERLAHTIKGVAGNLGVRAVQAAAGELEHAIRHRAAAEEVEALRQGVAAALDGVLVPLRAALGAGAGAVPPSPEATTAANPEETRAAAARLSELLSRFDPGAADFLESSRSALQTLFGEGWAEFQKLVRDYAFADADERLQAALKRPGA